MKTNTKFLVLTAILTCIVIVGVIAWLVQLQKGLIVTNMRNIITWGLYIATFAWLVGISAGGLIVTSSARVFNIKDWLQVEGLGASISFTSILLAAFSILPDLGRPDRLVNLFVYPQPFSPLIWDLIVIISYLVLTASELYFIFKLKTEVDIANLSSNKKLRIVAFIALPVAVLVHSITAWIFGLQITRPAWYSPLLAPLFLVSAIISGVSLVIFVGILAKKLRLIEIEEPTLSSLGRFLAVAIPIDLFLLFTEILTRSWAGVARELSPIFLQFFGPYWYLSWAQWGLAIAAFFILIIPRSKTIKRLLVASTFILIEVFLFRIELVIPGFAEPLIDYPPGVSIGELTHTHTPFSRIGMYFPSLIEIAITVGILAAGLLIVLILLKLLPKNK